MEFREKFDEVVQKMMEEDPEDFEFEDDALWHRNYAIGQRLPELVVNWPWIARKDTFGNGQPYIEVEEVDIENIEIDIFDDHVHVAAGGDWQYGTDFDLVLNENINTQSTYPFLACNIRYMSDIDGNDLEGDYSNQDEDNDDIPEHLSRT